MLGFETVEFLETGVAFEGVGGVLHVALGENVLGVEEDVGVVVAEVEGFFHLSR